MGLRPVGRGEQCRVFLSIVVGLGLPAPAVLLVGKRRVDLDAIGNTVEARKVSGRGPAEGITFIQ